MKIIFEREDAEAVILVDASNVVNALNRQLLNRTFTFYVKMFPYLISSYRIPGRMIAVHSKDILSVEGTTQGDKLAMSFYAISTIPLLNTLQVTSPHVSNVCLADDITGAGNLINLKNRWDTIISKC